MWFRSSQAQTSPSLQGKWFPVFTKHSALLAACFLAILMLLLTDNAAAHDVSRSDRNLIATAPGLQVFLYIWLGAKHMVTGYDHLLFLLGVIFYLRRIRDIALFVSLFALGHTVTLVSGVMLGLDVNAYLVDAIIGLSVAYKGFDNLGGFQQTFGDAPDERLAVFIFGLFHGLGLAAKLQDLNPNSEWLFANLLGFNLGVELGQFVALFIIVLVLRLISWKQTEIPKQWLLGKVVNVCLIIAGFALMAYQLARM